MKNNFDWISKTRSKVYNVQTYMNGKKSKKMKGNNGECKRLDRLIGKSETEYRSIYK